MQKDMILVGLESKVSNKETSTEKFKNSLADSLNELRAICQDVNDPVKSKL